MAVNKSALAIFEDKGTGNGKKSKRARLVQLTTKHSMLQ